METKSPSSLVEKARAFAKTLASSEEFEEYYSLQQKLKNDPEARSLLEELERKHQELRDMMQGKRGQEDVYVAIQELQDKIRSNDTIMRLAAGGANCHGHDPGGKRIHYRGCRF